MGGARPREGQSGEIRWHDLTIEQTAKPEEHSDGAVKNVKSSGLEYAIWPKLLEVNGELCPKDNFDIAEEQICRPDPTTRFV